MRKWNNKDAHVKASRLSLYAQIHKDIYRNGTRQCITHLSFPSLCPFSRLPWSMPNADQCRSKFWNWSQCRSILINADQFLSISLNSDQCRSMPDQAELIQHWSALIDNVLLMPWSGIDRNLEELRGIDRHLSAMIGIERHFGSLPWLWSALIDIDRHWAMIEGVLNH